MAQHELSRRQFSQITGGVFAVSPTALSVLESLTTPQPSMQWQFDTEADLVVLPGLYQQTSVLGENLILNGDETVYAVNRLSGNHQWRFGLDAEARKLTVGANAAYVTVDEMLYSLTANGTKRWQFQDSSIHSVIEGDDAVYASSLDRLYSIDIREGAVQWEYEGDLGVPTIVNDTIFAIQSENLHALDVIDGTKRWQSKTDEDGHANLVGVVNDSCIVWNHGTLYAVDTSTGSELWQLDTDDDSWGFWGETHRKHGVRLEQAEKYAARLRRSYRNSRVAIRC